MADWVGEIRTIADGAGSAAAQPQGGGGNKKQEQQYSGKRKLIGIGLMHKSNLVPIWDKEGAEEISKMRRN